MKSHDSSLASGWATHSAEQRRAWLELTPAERLAWLEQAKEFVAQSRAASKPDARQEKPRGPR